MVPLMSELDGDSGTIGLGRFFAIEEETKAQRGLGTGSKSHSRVEGHEVSALNSPCLSWDVGTCTGPGPVLGAAEIKGGMC